MIEMRRKMEGRKEEREGGRKKKEKKQEKKREREIPNTMFTDTISEIMQSQLFPTQLLER